MTKNQGFQAFNIPSEQKNEQLSEQAPRTAQNSTRNAYSVFSILPKGENTMENNFTIQTGNKIVDQMAKINFSGNVIPEIWYQTIINENGKVNLLAINILADVVYWYRPTENRDEQTGTVSYSKKFHDDELLQRSYEQLCQKFNVSNKQAREALIVLEQLGVVKRVFRTIMTVGGACPNVMFLELFPLALLKLTYPDDYQDISENGGTSEIENTSLQNCKEVFTKKETRLSQKGNTNTENTTEITTEISTTTMVPAETPSTAAPSTATEDKNVVVQQTKELFAEYNFSDDEINSLAKTAYYHFEKLYDAYLCLKQQPGTINNRMGWLIGAIRGGYKPKYRPDQEAKSVKNSFHNFSQRDYDMGALERALLGF